MLLLCYYYVNDSHVNVVMQHTCSTEYTIFGGLADLALTAKSKSPPLSHVLINSNNE